MLPFYCNYRLTETNFRLLFLKQRQPFVLRLLGRAWAVCHDLVFKVWSAIFVSNSSYQVESPDCWWKTRWNLRKKIQKNLNNSSIYVFENKILELCCLEHRIAIFTTVHICCPCEVPLFIFCRQGCRDKGLMGVDQGSNIDAKLACPTTVSIH